MIDDRLEAARVGRETLRWYVDLYGPRDVVRLAPGAIVRSSPPDGAGGRVRGHIEDIAYLGDISIYHVRVPDGPRIQVTQTNLVPRAEQPLTWGDEIDLWWTHRGGVVLLS